MKDAWIVKISKWSNPMMAFGSVIEEEVTAPAQPVVRYEQEGFISIGWTRPDGGGNEGIVLPAAVVAEIRVTSAVELE
jgi:hypothetical protein